MAATNPASAATVAEAAASSSPSSPDAPPPPPAHRELALLNDAFNRERQFCGNAVQTSKYSLLPFRLNFFLYLNLFEQFHKAANVYFLLIAALQLIPGLSPTGRFTTLIPLCMVLLLTMAKDALEDWRRYQSDQELNGRSATVWRNDQWVSVQWSQICVGDLCLLLKNSHFPADMALLYSTGVDGECGIEASSLDGETNLKKRYVPRYLQGRIDRVNPSKAANWHIVCELPNNRLYNFDGRVETPWDSDIPLNADNILLRGATLRNTEAVIGAVVFTGPDTKLMKNSSARTLKMSHVDILTNWQVLYIFGVQICVVLGCTMASVVLSREVKNHWYLVEESPDSIVVYLFSRFATFLILFNNLIPISLYVTLEMVKLVQTVFINSDLQMYSEEVDTAANCRTSALNEELGQVEFIFSDKTGTLTQNRMEFLKFSCTRYDPLRRREVVTSYGTGTTEVGRAAALRRGAQMASASSPHAVTLHKTASSSGGGAALAEAVDAAGLSSTANGTGNAAFRFTDPRINNLAWATQDNRDKLEFFFTFLALCHAAVPERKSDGSVLYQSASPDETCLVMAAKCIGVEYVGCSGSKITLKVRGVERYWTLHHIIEFDSARKRMSVIVEDSNGTIMIMTKGADMVILPRLHRDLPASVLEDTEVLLTQFAEEGLRTLVCGMAVLDRTMYVNWSKRFATAAASIEGRAQAIATVVEELEKDLMLVGTTAIEDKLQDGVPQTIELLAAAGAKIWVLTGDKQETAVNIGFACSLLHDDMGIFLFQESMEANLAQVLQAYLADAKAADQQQDMALIVDGSMLERILGPQGGVVVSSTDEAATSAAKSSSSSSEYGAKRALRREAELFLSLATRCKAVICCRASPVQKADIVNLVKNNMNSVTLAIGDGANDVSMIQAAHVGVGISGFEGVQAARAADYSIAQFRYLGRLILVHGRYNYRRVSKLLLYCFYKNVTLYLTQLWFVIFNYGTGQSLYDSWALSMYNVAFTAYPVVALGTLDKDIHADRLMDPKQFPELYHDGLHRSLYNTARFWLYTANGIVHSLLSFFLTLRTTQYLTTAEGWDLGMVGSGCVTYTIVLIVVSVKLGLEVNSWTVVHAMILLASLLLWFAFLGLYGNLFGVIRLKDFALWYGMPGVVLKQPSYWLSIVIVPTIALMRDVCWKLWRQNFGRSLRHTVQELERQKKPFSRREVLRYAPQLLPRFQSLKPYEANVKMYSSVFVDEGLSLVPRTTLLNAATSASNAANKAKRVVRGEAGSYGPTSSKSGSGPHGFFALPGTVNIRDIRLDDDAVML